MLCSLVERRHLTHDGFCGGCSELSKFIASGRLFCKIDKVHGIIETQHLSTKNHLYQQVLKHGDVLLARVAKLSRVIDM